VLLLLLFPLTGTIPSICFLYNHSSRPLSIFPLWLDSLSLSLSGKQSLHSLLCGLQFSIWVSSWRIEQLKVLIFPCKFFTNSLFWGFDIIWSLAQNRPFSKRDCVNLSANCLARNGLCRVNCWVLVVTEESEILMLVSDLRICSFLDLLFLPAALIKEVNFS
jgi:hypothetical protein